MTLARLIDNKVGIILDAAASICGPGGSQATRLMTQYDCANGWRIATSHRAYQCGTSRNAPMAPLADPTSSYSVSPASIAMVGAASLR